MTNMEYEILQAVESVDDEVLAAESAVLDSLYNQYSKAFTLMEYCKDETVLEQFDIFAEANGDKKDDGNELQDNGFWKKKDDTFLKKAIAFIVRLVQWIGRAISGKKNESIKETIDEGEKVAQTVASKISNEDAAKIEEALGTDAGDETGGSVGDKIPNCVKAISVALAAIGVGFTIGKAGQIIINPKKTNKNDEVADNSAANDAPAEVEDDSTDEVVEKEDIPAARNAGYGPIGKSRPTAVELKGYATIIPTRKKYTFWTSVNFELLVTTLNELVSWAGITAKSYENVERQAKNGRDTDARVLYTDDSKYKIISKLMQSNPDASGMKEYLRTKFLIFKTNGRKHTAGDFWRYLEHVHKELKNAATSLDKLEKSMAAILEAGKTNPKVTENLKNEANNLMSKANLLKQFVEAFNEIEYNIESDIRACITFFGGTNKNGNKFSAKFGTYVDDATAKAAPVSSKKAASLTSTATGDRMLANGISSNPKKDEKT